MAFVLNAKKETSYLFADILNCDFSKLFDGNPDIKSNRDIENLHFIANVDEHNNSTHRRIVPFSQY